MEALIVKNISHEGPGLITQLLDLHDVKYTVVELQTDLFPDPREYDAVFVMGGPASANDRTRIMLAQIQRTAEALDAGIPYLGACLGMQTLVKAAGGQIEKNPVKEIGWKDSEGEYYEVTLNHEGIQDPLFRNVPSTLPIFHLHGETGIPPPSMKLLATGKHCSNQIVKFGSAYGIQGHFEITRPAFETLIKLDPDLAPLDREKLRKDDTGIRLSYEAVSKKILTNFLRFAKLIQ